MGEWLFGYCHVFVAQAASCENTMLLRSDEYPVSN